jgi:superfamily I DNA and/or RNA helicase
VTLLDDFRMHPLISQFVSDQFYREEGVRPGCCAENRQHGLGMYADKPVAWIDVPAAIESETGSQSKSRPIEVTLTMREVEKVLQASDDPSLRIGVITFYQQQAQRLEEAWQRLPLEWKERVLVGTVDAFQGLEFDVVFLSTVRSNRRESVKDRVGFLAIENRLCVALSRAKRLLVVVGDAETVAGSAEQPWVPALQAFSTLCRSEEGWYEQRTGR